MNNNQVRNENRRIERNEDLELIAIQYLIRHNLQAVGNANGTVTTVNEYVDHDGVFHSEPIILTASMRGVRDFLGY